MSRFDFTLNNDGKVVAVADRQNGRMLFGGGAGGSMRMDSADWVMPVGAGGQRQDAADRPQRITSAKEARQYAMRRDGFRGWVAPAAPALSPALARFDGASAKPKPAGLVSSAAEARELMSRRGSR